MRAAHCTGVDSHPASAVCAAGRRPSRNLI